MLRKTLVTLVSVAAQLMVGVEEMEVEVEAV